MPKAGGKPCPVASQVGLCPRCTRTEPLHPCLHMGHAVGADGVLGLVAVERLKSWHQCDVGRKIGFGSPPSIGQARVEKPAKVVGFLRTRRCSWMRSGYAGLRREGKDAAVGTLGIESSQAGPTARSARHAETMGARAAGQAVSNRSRISQLAIRCATESQSPGLACRTRRTVGYSGSWSP